MEALVIRCAPMLRKVAGSVRWVKKRGAGLAHIKDDHPQGFGRAPVVADHFHAGRLDIGLPRADDDGLPTFEVQSELAFEHIHRDGERCV